MKISFERSGGFAGMHVLANFDLDEMQPDDASLLEELVNSADFFNIPETRNLNATPDGFQYIVTVEHQEVQHTLYLGEGEMPEEVRPLLEELSLLARSHRRPN